MIPYDCPYCERRPVGAAASIPYVRGMVIQFKIGEKQSLGCAGCVRLNVFKETGLSLLIGWFSPIALILNPLFIAYGLVRGLLVFRNDESVRKVLRNRGLPVGDPSDAANVGSAIAITSLMVGKHVERREPISLATLTEAVAHKAYPEPAIMAILAREGVRSIPGFDAGDLDWCAVSWDRLAHPDFIARSTLRILPLSERQSVAAFLNGVASSVEPTVGRQFQSMARLLESKP